MTTRGVRIAFAVAVLVVLLLPKRSPCRYPGQDCSVVRAGRVCTTTEVEPFGSFLLERLLHRDLGIAYSESSDCP